MSNIPQAIEGKRFDAPLVIPGDIYDEPERYIAEKPYELTKFEFSILRKSFASEFWFTLMAGATAGIALSIIGKTVAALLDKKTPSLEAWECWAVVIGILLSILSKLFFQGQNDKERLRLEQAIDGHFTENRPRRVHLTNKQDTK